MTRRVGSTSASKRGQEAIGGAQIAHAGHEYDQLPVTFDVVADPAVRAREVGGGQALMRFVS